MYIGGENFLAAVAWRVNVGSRKGSANMPWHPAGSVAVIVANHFNPSIFKQGWLTKLGVVGPDDLLEEGNLFSDTVAQVRSKYFHMLVLPGQMQFVPAVLPEQEEELLLDKVGSIVRELPHTPYTAIGLNFNWQLSPNDGDMGRLTRELFTTPDRPLYQRFGGDNARFGAYLSKDFGLFRLKLDVRPVHLAEGEETHYRLQFLFNFHSSVDGAEQIVERLGHWNEIRQEAREILESVEPGLQP